MIAELSDADTEALLQSLSYGHLACAKKDASALYLVPVTYAYFKKAVYSFSFAGRKIEMLRRHPEACFQVEELSEPGIWKSAIAWGTYEELEGEERQRAFKMLLKKLWEEGERDQPLFMPFRNSAKTLERARNEDGIVLYRINIRELSGRMEQYE